MADVGVEGRAEAVVAQPEYSGVCLPNLVVAAGPEVSRRFMEFFLVSIRNPNTRSAYAGALKQFFLWCDDRGLLWSSLSPPAFPTVLYSRPFAVAPQLPRCRL